MYGDFECLKAAVQNGADAVYFGASLFSARAYATNFEDLELEKAINYAKLRGVKTHLTLNTLIKDDEFEDAFNLAKKAYELGIDAIIIQDIGLASILHKYFPDLSLHASTQMTSTNLNQIKNLEEKGFERVVLSRECSLSEIENICQNSNLEIEVFIHGALCISYSGQCLFSSMVGGRSGNRGKCAQPCRLPYSLFSESNLEKELDKGYLLSTRDLCSLETLPDLLKCGVSSLKIEGRMKSPIYVATVTRIYRKYIDLATKYIHGEIKDYKIEPKDLQDLMQVFNRGEFSKGHLLETPNKKLIFPQKPNNMGIYLGKVSKFNPNKWHITCKLENSLSIGDGISFENETTKYTVSELMQNNSNIRTAKVGDIVTFGRMKGNIKTNSKIYKISDKELSETALNSFSKESKKIQLECSLSIHANSKIKVFAKHKDIECSFIFDYTPELSRNAPITEQKIHEQFNKTLNTCFEFSNIEIELDNNLFIPTSIINEIRRQTIANIETAILSSFKRKTSFANIPAPHKFRVSSPTQSAILLNTLNISFDYGKLKNIDKIYIPLKYFSDKNYSNIIKTLSTKGKIYIYLPIILKDRFINNIKALIKSAYSNFKISGCVISEISLLEWLKGLNTEIIANYTFNIFNSYSAQYISNYGISTITLSPELTSDEMSSIQINTPAEIIVYGKIPLMTMSYCLLGKSNRCYKECKKMCTENQNFYIKDRYNFNFRIIPDNIQTLTTVYNSRNIELNLLTNYCNRFDFLDESIEEINLVLDNYLNI